MSLRMIKYLIALVLIAIPVTYVAYLVIFNAELVTVSFWPGKTEQSRLAVVIISAFALGLFVSGVIAFLFSAKHSLEDWLLRRRQNTKHHHNELIVGAREELAANNYSAARHILEKVINGDPNNLHARVLLLNALTKQGELADALAVLQKARVEDKSNTELLIHGSEINAALGNLTAACDNLSLLLSIKPNHAFALEKSVEYLSRLGHFEKAIELQRRCIRHSEESKHEQQYRTLADLELALALKNNRGKPRELRRAIEEVLRNHRQHAASFKELSTLDLEAGSNQSASKNLEQAYIASGEAKYLETLAKLWLEKTQPEVALKSVKKALEIFKKKHSKDSAASVDGELVLLRLLLQLEMIDEAEERLRNLLKSEIANTTTYRSMLLGIEAKILRRRGKLDEAFQLLETELMAIDFLGDKAKKPLLLLPLLARNDEDGNPITDGSQISPVLSTP